MKEKKIFIMKKKSFVVQNRFGLLPKLYCEKKICIVRLNCIAA